MIINQIPLPTLTIAVSTIGDGYKNLHVLPPQVGVFWIVLIQQTKGYPENLFSDRPDLLVIRLNCIGLSNSRNQALKHAQTSLLLFADDDAVLDINGINALRQKFAEDRTLDFGAGWRKEHFPKRHHQRKTYKLTRYNTGRICAPELILRLRPFRQKSNCFNTDFGLGATHEIGEEYIFVTDALAKGMSGKSFPIIMASHPHPSTGNNWNSQQILAARHCVIDHVFGRLSRLVKILYAIRHRKKFASLSTAVHFAIGKCLTNTPNAKSPASKSGANPVVDAHSSG